MLVLLFLIIIHTYNFMISLLLKKKIILQRLNAIQTRDATTVFPSSIRSHDHYRMFLMTECFLVQTSHNFYADQFRY